MRRNLPVLAVACSLLPLLASVAGCAGSPPGTVQSVLSLSPFNQAKMHHYQTLAQEETRAGHATSADWFSRKVGRLSEGAELSPENPAPYLTTHPEHLALTQAHEELTALLIPEHGLEEEFPDEAAAAVAYYDCWLLQASLNHRVASDCYPQFLNAKRDLTDRLKAKAPPPLPITVVPAAKETLSAVQTPPPPLEPVQVGMRFAPGFATMDTESRQNIIRLVRDYGKNATYQLYPAVADELSHTKAYSTAQLRLLAIQNELMRSGVGVAQIIPMPAPLKEGRGFAAWPIVEVIPPAPAIEPMAAPDENESPVKTEQLFTPEAHQAMTPMPPTPLMPEPVQETPSAEPETVVPENTAPYSSPSPQDYRG